MISSPENGCSWVRSCIAWAAAVPAACRPTSFARAAARPSSPTAPYMSDSGSPQTPSAQRSYEGPSIAATGTERLASAGDSEPSSARPWRGLSGVPIVSSSRPIQPLTSLGSSAPTSQ